VRVCVSVCVRVCGPCADTLVCLQIDDNNVFEELVNSITHGIGMIAAVVGFIILLYHCIDKTGVHVAAATIYSISLITVYASSFFMHTLFKV
jgi:hemolysin III